MVGGETSVPAPFEILFIILWARLDGFGRFPKDFLVRSFRGMALGISSGVSFSPLYCGILPGGLCMGFFVSRLTREIDGRGDLCKRSETSESFDNAVLSHRKIALFAS